ncbi:putative sulfate transporter 3.4 [Datura stramonium]|uniref:Sulfate transporter 3.4 n=1 Tax=Datura stramonium TaxID=4076 RepID=A0ABS8USD9_DATST|nr:putative sulfate transporter 3.4 [Datura stramonium]
MTLNSIKVEDSAGDASDEHGAEASSSASMLPGGVHKVCLPPYRTTFQKLRHRLSEIFFPDDPLHRFKNQTGLRRFVLGIEFFFPVLEWGPKYNVKLLRSDIIAGITIASLSIPQGISYAKLANLPPILGLCK